MSGFYRFTGILYAKETINLQFARQKDNFVFHKFLHSSSAIISSMIIKFIVVIAFILIIISLGSALLHLVKHKSDEDSQKTVKALTFRIALSLLLFIFVYVMIATGLYTPHGIGVRMHAPKPASSAAPAPENTPPSN
jgi:uncharacterized membrane protein